MQDVLRYESRDRGSLEPGEELLWEGGTNRRGQPQFRITNRRAFYAKGKANAAKHLGTVRWPFRHSITVRVPRNGRATILLGTTLWIAGVEDWATAAGYLAMVNHGRITRRRRESFSIGLENSMDVTPTSATAAESIDYSSVATDLGLLEQERVLWTGRPIVNQPLRWPIIRRKLIVLVMLAIPSVLGWRVLSEKMFEVGNVVFGMIAAIWILIGIHSLTTKPIITRWRLRRTQYVLSSRRAFVVEPLSGGRRIRFIFIDALAPRFDRCVQSNGSGDINIDHTIAFKHIPDAAAVHQKLVNAVLTARRDLPDLGWQDLSVVR